MRIKILLLALPRRAVPTAVESLIPFEDDVFREQLSIFCVSEKLSLQFASRHKQKRLRIIKTCIIELPRVYETGHCIVVQVGEAHDIRLQIDPINSMDRKIESKVIACPGETSVLPFEFDALLFKIEEEV